MSKAPTSLKRRQRKIFDAFRWTGDRAALLAWIATLPIRLEIHDCEFAGDPLGGSDVLFTWTTIEADPKDPLDQPERVDGDRHERDQWIVLQEKSTWVKGNALTGVGYTDEKFRAKFEEVISPSRVAQGTDACPADKIAVDRVGDALFNLLAATKRTAR